MLIPTIGHSMTRVRSNWTYVALIAILSLVSAANLYLPQGDFVGIVPLEELPASRPVMALAVAGIMALLYGGLGWIGILLARRLGFPDLWEAEISNHQRFVVPALIGIAVGCFFVLADTLFVRMHSLGPLPHPPFPTSLVASIAAGIGEETIFRLFFMAFWIWLISAVLLRGRHQSLVFWLVASCSAVFFALGHIPSAMMLFGLEHISQIPLILYVEIILLNSVLSFLAAIYWRQFGFLAAVGIHFWTDVVWHVIWGALG